MTSVSTEIVTGAFVTKQAKPSGAVATAASPAMDRRGAELRGAAAQTLLLLLVCSMY